ncbi:MAG: primosomal protein N' [Ruthenibacterium sp.]
MPEICPKCGEKIKYTGFGTQRVEEELAEKFPTARVLRMDADSTSRKNAHEVLLKRFADGEYDIMLGTQMVAKGLDFEKVTLVGVLGIDQLLFAQGYKAFENVFSLVTQVVGRGGRANEPGRAIIQTVDTEHPVLNLAAKQDYLSFYEQEIGFRQLNLYPPFCTICMVGFSGAEETQTQEAAVAFSKMVQVHVQKTGGIPLRILGPVPMNIAMINHHYRYRLTLKCRNDAAFRNLMKTALADYSKQGYPAKAAIYLDFYSDSDL